MGNSSKKPEDFDVVKSYNRQQWVNREKRNGFEIWENTLNGLRADVYPIRSSLNSNDLENYQLRRNNSSNIVKVHHVGFEKNQNLCSKSSEAFILTERIPKRLDAVNNLTQPEALCVLRSAYNGFNTLGSFYGPIEPYEDMVCFNEEGRPKVWLNSNLSLNQAEEKRQGDMKKDHSQRNHIYVGKILDMVENRTLGQRLPDSLKNKFRQIGPKNYFEAINILEEYAAENRVPIPETINIGKSLKGSTISQPAFQTNTHSNRFQSVQPVVIHADYTARSIQNRPAALPSQYSQNIASGPQVQYIRHNNQSGYSASSPANMQLRNRQISFNNQSYQNVQPQYHSNTVSHHFPHQNNTSVLQRSRSGQFGRPIQNYNSPSVAALSPRIISNAVSVAPPSARPYNIPVITLPHPHPQTSYIQQNVRFDSPSKVVSNQAIQYNRVHQPQQPLYPIRVQQQSEMINSQHNESPTKHSPGILGHVRKQNSQQFVQVQQRIEPPTNQYISIAEAKRAQRDEEDRKLRNQADSNSSRQVAESGNLIRDSQQSYNNFNNYEQHEEEQQNRPHQPEIMEQLEQHEQKYIDDLEEEQARQEDQIEQNPDHQYAEYIKKQKIRQIQEQAMRDDLEQYQGHQDAEDSSDQHEQHQQQDQNYEQDQQQYYQEQRRNNLIQTEYKNTQKHQYLIRKDTEEEQRQQKDYEQEEQKYKPQFRNHQSQQQQLQEAEEVERDRYEDRYKDRYQDREEEQNNNQDHVEDQQIYQQHQRPQVTSYHSQQQKQQQQQQQGFYQYFVQGRDMEKADSDEERIQQSDRVNQTPRNNLKNVTSQEYLENQSVENSQTRNQILQAALHVSSNIQRVVSMEKKLSDFDSLKGSEGLNKVQDQSSEPGFEAKKVQILGVESEYYKGERQSDRNNLQRIPEDARYQDIQAYIKQKYSSYLRDDTDNIYTNPSKPAYDYEQKHNNEDEDDYDVRKMAWYVESKYDQMRSSKTAQQARRDSNPKKGSINSKENYEQERMSDMLDVKNMERSLDKKYSSMKSQPKIENQPREDDNEFDIKKLEQNLIRFEESRVGGGTGQIQNTSQVQNFETSQVSKIGSFQQRINRRNSSISREMNFKQQNSYTYIMDKDYRKPSSNYSGVEKQRDSFANNYEYKPALPKTYEKNSKISNFLGSIEQKFNKYVANNNAYKGSGKYSPRDITDVHTKKPYQATKKPYETYGRSYEPENENSYISSRLATAKFEYAESDEGKKAALEPKLNSNKYITYDQLRKYMWS